mmetsp:Transcript_4664/g.17273  ORF Transcript_4664/g.17273 Transcript_4664/m.17273 type:complete len:328 (+) Transcript_4664:1026-2009(+)
MLSSRFTAHSHSTTMNECAAISAGRAATMVPQQINSPCCMNDPPVLPTCAPSTSTAALPFVLDSSSRVMYTISSAGLNNENFAARSMTYRMLPPHTKTGSQLEVCIKKPPLAIHMEKPKNAHPSPIAAFGVTLKVPAHPSFLNSHGAASMRVQVKAPDMSCTSPMKAEYACGEGCRIRSWPFQATWKRIELRPCATLMIARHVTSGFFMTNRRASNSPVFDCFGFFPASALSALMALKLASSSSAFCDATLAASFPAPPSARCFRRMMYACVAAMATPQHITIVMRNRSLTPHTWSCGTSGCHVPLTHFVMAPLVACATFAPTPSRG